MRLASLCAGLLFCHQGREIAPLNVFLRVTYMVMSDFVRKELTIGLLAEVEGNWVLRNGCINTVGFSKAFIGISLVLYTRKTKYG